jgi:hypothetical protein
MKTEQELQPEHEDFDEYDFFEEDWTEDLPLSLKLELKKQVKAEHKPRKMRDGYY